MSKRILWKVWTTHPMIELSGMPIPVKVDDPIIKRIYRHEFTSDIEEYWEIREKLEGLVGRGLLRFGNDRPITMAPFGPPMSNTWEEQEARAQGG